MKASDSTVALYQCLVDRLREPNALEADLLEPCDDEGGVNHG
jgi:hypothetical protein